MCNKRNISADLYINSKLYYFMFNSSCEAVETRTGDGKFCSLWVVVFCPVTMLEVVVGGTTLSCLLEKQCTNKISM